MKRLASPYAITILLWIFVSILSLAIGSISIPVQTVLQLLAGKLGLASTPAGTELFSTILFELRLPRTILIALTGAALAGSGAAYQGLFRNPLADPYLIGVASGAGLGAVIAMSVHWPAQLLGMYTIPISAFLAGMITVVLVYSIARIGKTVPTTNLLLAGVTVSSFCTALTSFLMLRAHNELRRAITWLLGGSTLTGWDPVIAVLPYILVGLTSLIFLAYPLNVLQFGEDQAQQLGLNVNTVKTLIVLAASLTAASAVAFSGIIGFVGLIVPHLVRILWTTDYRKVIPLSLGMGMVVLLITDILSRVILPQQEIPLGIITALAGAPFFLWVLRRSKQQAFW
jgi:iron complex transport system permease protein